MIFYTLLSILLPFAFTRFLYRLKHQNHPPVPPGPVGFLIIGNILQIPKDRPWLRFDRWRREFGDIVHITVLGQSTVVLGSAQAAIDLLDNRGAIYSDRPPAIMAGELVGWARGLGYTPGPPNLRFKEFRRLFHSSIGPRACLSQNVTSIVEKENRKFLLKLVSKGDEFAEWARQSTGSLILRLAYGYEVKQTYDPFVKIVEDAMLGFAKASEPGWIVDSFPMLKHLPEWFPGAEFKRVARLMRADLDRLYDVPFSFVKKQLERGRAFPSFTSMFLEEKGDVHTQLDEDFIKAAAASLYSGGAETTPSSITSFILAMTLNPEVQKKAQDELDAVIGKDTDSGCRFPSLEDRDELPYINALIKELWRWNPSVPLGLPHVAKQDDVYRGYFIKKGTVVWANVWSILHNEDVYPEPFEFRPERFLDTQGHLRDLKPAEDPTEIAFGFGRRICPGLHFADISVFINISTILYTFSISPLPGQPLPEVEYDGFISHPRPFKCCIEPRSQKMKALIIQSAQED